MDTTIVEQLGLAIRASAQASPLPIQKDHAVGFVRLDPDAQHAEANLLVADRFVVSITGRGYEDSAVVRRIAEQFDVEGLALLR